METKQENKPFYGVLDIGGSFIKFGYGRDNTLFFVDKRRVAEVYNTDTFCSILDQCILDLLELEPSIQHFCIGCPGTINNIEGFVTGVIPNLPFLKLFKLKEYLELKFKREFFIENDANLAALGESYYNKDQSLLVFTIGTGIGSGFIYKNEIYHGDNYAGMEIGHTIVNLTGRMCKCGKQGCAEAYCSANSMLEIINEKFSDLHLSTIYDLLIYSQNFPEILSELHALQDYLAVTIANAVMTLNPSVIAIGGGVIEIEEYDFSYLQNKILDLLLETYKTVIVRKAKNYNLSGLLGGIYLCQQILE